MKIKPEDYHPELRKSAGLIRWMFGGLNKPFVIKLINKLSGFLKGKNHKHMLSEERMIPSSQGGYAIRIRIFRPIHQKEPLPLMLYLHGGGYVLGNPEQYLNVMVRFMERRPCIIIAPDYRKAFDAPYPAAFDDCFDTLSWMAENWESLGGISDQVIVGGHSAGGGLTAAVCLKARDTGWPKIAFQMPLYPMIDDTNSTNSALDNNAPVWNEKSNKMAWAAYLRELFTNGKEIPAYAAPARNRQFSGLAPCISFVGSLDPFHDETKYYITSLKEAGILCHFQVFHGCYHAFEQVMEKTQVSKEAWEFLLSSYENLYNLQFAGFSPKEKLL